MGFALPQSLRDRTDNRAAAGNYGNTSEYTHVLVRRDPKVQANARAPMVQTSAFD